MGGGTGGVMSVLLTRRAAPCGEGDSAIEKEMEWAGKVGGGNGTAGLKRE